MSNELPALEFPNPTMEEGFQKQIMINNIDSVINDCIHLYQVKPINGEAELLDRLEWFKNTVVQLCDRERIYKHNIKNLVKNYAKQI